MAAHTHDRESRSARRSDPATDRLAQPMQRTQKQTGPVAPFPHRRARARAGMRLAKLGFQKSECAVRQGQRRQKIGVYRNGYLNAARVLASLLAPLDNPAFP